MTIFMIVVELAGLGLLGVLYYFYQRRKIIRFTFQTTMEDVETFLKSKQKEYPADYFCKENIDALTKELTSLKDQSNKEHVDQLVFDLQDIKKFIK